MAAWLRHPIRVLTLTGLLVTGSTPLPAGARDQGQGLDRYLPGIDLESEVFASAASGAVVVKLLQTCRVQKRLQEAVHSDLKGKRAVIELMEPRFK